jgi:hypothetical protein
MIDLGIAKRRRNKINNKVLINFKVDKEILEGLKKIARDNQTSMTKVFVHILKEKLIEGGYINK